MKTSIGFAAEPLQEVQLPDSALPPTPIITHPLPPGPVLGTDANAGPTLVGMSLPEGAFKKTMPLAQASPELILAQARVAAKLAAASTAAGANAQPPVSHTMVSSPVEPEVAASGFNPAPPAVSPSQAPPRALDIEALRANPMLAPISGETMVGVAAPDLSKIKNAPPAAMPAPAPGGPPIMLQSDNRTVLGVQSPFGPGMPLPPAPAAPFLGAAPTQSPAPYAPSANAQQWADEPPPSRAVKPKGVPILGVAFLVCFIALVAGGLAIFFWRKPTNLSIRPAALPSGAEALDLTCESCSDGTTVTALGSTATIKDKKAMLEAKTALVVGENRIEFQLKRPEKHRIETLSAVVPLQFRLKPKFTSLATGVLRIDVQAAPTAKVTVDGKTLPLDASGHAVAELPLSTKTTGAASKSQTIEVPVSYRIDTGTQVFDGNLATQVRIPPLTLDSPVHASDAPAYAFASARNSYWLSGQASPNARVLLDGKPTTLSGTGAFALELPVDGAAHSLSASAQDSASRTLSFTVRKLGKTDAEMSACKANGSVEIDGKVVAAKGNAEGHYTSLVVQGATCKGDCSWIVSYGDDLNVAAGTKVRGCGVLESATGNAKHVVAEWLVTH